MPKQQPIPAYLLTQTKHPPYVARSRAVFSGIPGSSGTWQELPRNYPPYYTPKEPSENQLECNTLAEGRISKPEEKWSSRRL